MISHTPKGQRARDRILVAAEALLATRGFHGTSTRDVAAAAKLPLATTIYHFARKEQLYAAVLEAIASELVDALAMVAREPDPAHALDQLAHVLARWAAHRPDRVRLLVRELLDNPVRLPHVHRLPLAPVLAHAAAIVRAGVAAGVADVTDPEVCVLHFVGALSYFVAAWPTVERIVGSPRARKIERAYEREVLELARRVFGRSDRGPDNKEKPRATRTTGPAGAARARTPRREDDRPRARPDPGLDLGVRRAGSVRTRARGPVPRAPARGRARVAARQPR